MQDNLVDFSGEVEGTLKWVLLAMSINYEAGHRSVYMPVCLVCLCGMHFGDWEVEHERSWEREKVWISCVKEKIVENLQDSIECLFGHV